VASGKWWGKKKRESSVISYQKRKSVEGGVWKKKSAEYRVSREQIKTPVSYT